MTMFFLPAAIFAHVPGITWGDALHNWLFACLGNLVGAAVFVSGAYWYLYAREPAPPPGDTPRGRDADCARAARERVAAEA
ncbi:MAG TPA: hypothetical protein VGP78_01010 [Solirubrobacteraceae bacterium]|nr:hypothetical protein [Solirubrobacteraceae bacterium]